MLSKASNVMAVLAILLAPLFSLILPAAITGRLLTAHVELKDAVLLISVGLLAIVLYASQGMNALMRLVARQPFYARVDFNYIYLTDGTVLIRNGFDYVNGWQASGRLPREDLIWHKKITKSDLFYRFYERGKLRDRSMTSEQPTIISAVPVANGRAGTDYRYCWVPSVAPALGRKERISFVVEIMSVRTETAAFQKGTKLGFGVNVATNRVALKAHAPFGYRFMLIDPELTIRDSETLAEISVPAAWRPLPVVSADGSVLSLDVRRPLLGRRYWVHYRFEPLAA